MPAGSELVLLMLATAFGGFLLGSVNSALIISSAAHLPDPRTGGSHNPGATNMMRVAGTLPGVLTFLGDAGKGVLAVWAALWLAQWFEVDRDPLVAAAMFAVVAGHIWPIYYGFRGGKGVATWAGALALATPVLAMCLAATWLLTLALFRQVGLASVVAAAAVPVYAYAGSTSATLSLVLLVLAAVVIVRHRENLERMVHQGEDL